MTTDRKRARHRQKPSRAKSKQGTSKRKTPTSDDTPGKRTNRKDKNAAPASANNSEPAQKVASIEGVTDKRVGFGQPPINHQFPKGKSGNPRGRPKGSRNRKSILESAALEKVVATKKGKKTRISKYDAIIQSHLNQALNGNANSTKIVLNEIEKTGALSDEDERTVSEVRPLSKSEEDILALMLSMLNEASNDA